MYLSASDIENVISLNYSIDFIEITLTQIGSPYPIVYSGPGTVMQMSDGRLHLKLYHAFVDGIKELYPNTGKVRPGKIIGDSYYFSLKATDIKGREWTSDKIDVPKGFSIPAAGKIINTHINDLQSRGAEGSIGSGKIFIKYFVIGDFQIPLNKFEDLPGGGFELNTYYYDYGGYDIELIKKDKYVIITATFNADDFDERIKSTLLEAIGILCGHRILPVFSVFGTGDEMLTTWSSITLISKKDWLPSPIPLNLPGVEISESFAGFIRSYLREIKEPLSEVYRYWYKVYCSYIGGMDTLALSVSVSIEGVVKSYMKEYEVADEDYLRLAVDAEKIIGTLSLDPRIKRRLIASLNMVKHVNPKVVLFNMANGGALNKGLVESWIVLRNKSTHAYRVDVEKYQDYLDKIYDCLLLFYTLIFDVIKYRGLFVDYSSDNWPSKPFAVRIITNNRK
jgi:hypothetical protein